MGIKEDGIPTSAGLAEDQIRKEQTTKPIPTEKCSSQCSGICPTCKKRYPLFERLDKVIDALQAKEAQTAHHLDKQNQLLEKLIALLERKARSPAPEDYLRMGKTPTPPPTPPEDYFHTEKPTPPAPSKPYIDTVRDAFTDDLRDMLNFMEGDDGYVIIKPKRFLGSDNFAKIAATVRNLGGEYISAGKDSHFKAREQTEE